MLLGTFVLMEYLMNMHMDMFYGNTSFTVVEYNYKKKEDVFWKQAIMILLFLVKTMRNYKNKAVALSKVC